MKRALLCAFLMAPVAAVCQGDAKREEAPKPAQSIPELQQRLEKILKDSHTPGVSVAIVHKDGPEWVAGLGMADVAAKREVTRETLFRIGSTSKAFASMAILLLADQGRLSLDDPVKRLVPEIWFENRWEASDPVRVVHLLEHTTGWDDMHLREYAKDAPGMSLRDGLEYDHQSRISRWPPGTRMAYCNSGPGVAGYIVEKLTGQRFEDFVSQNLFQPIGMNTATYFQPIDASTTTILYHNDGKTPYLYWNMLLRPAGSINASAKDMANYVQFCLNRGAVNSAVVVSAANFERMESPQTTWAAKEGLKAGYGLGNYWSFHEGFTWHGHNGGIAGGLTEMAYMPEYGMGYFFSINSDNGDAFEKIGKAIRGYMTNKLTKPAVPEPGMLPSNAAEYAGWYEPNSPRVELVHFMERLRGLTLVRFADGKMVMTTLRHKETFVPVSGMQFRYVPRKDLPEPVATTSLLEPKEEGLYLQVGAGSTMKKLPLIEVLLTGFVLLAIISIGLYAPFWLLGGLSKKRKRPAERAMRLWPLLAVLSLVAFVGIFITCSSDLITRLGNVTGWSMALCLTTILFAVATLASVVAVRRAPAEGVRRGVLWYSAMVTVALLIAMLYLAYWGMIGLRTWA